MITFERRKALFRSNFEATREKTNSFYSENPIRFLQSILFEEKKEREDNRREPSRWSRRPAYLNYASLSCIAGCGPPVASLRRHSHTKSKTMAPRQTRKKRGRKPQWPQYPLSPCQPDGGAPSALMRSECLSAPGSHPTPPPKSGRVQTTSNSGKTWGLPSSGCILS